MSSEGPASQCGTELGKEISGSPALREHKRMQAGGKSDLKPYGQSAGMQNAQWSRFSVEAKAKRRVRNYTTHPLCGKTVKSCVSYHSQLGMRDPGATSFNRNHISAPPVCMRDEQARSGLGAACAEIPEV